MKVDKVTTAEELRGDRKGQGQALQGKSLSLGLRLLPSKVAAEAIVQAILPAFHPSLLDITVNQTRALRKRQLIKEFERKYKQGTYWGISTQINHYELPDAIVKDNKITASMHNVRTRLDPFSRKEQGQLINWGYALCDTAIRKYVQPELPKPEGFPCPDISIG